MEKRNPFKPIFKLLIVVFALVLFNLSACKKNDPDSCNGDNLRRDIKIVIDEQANDINLIPIVISVNEIGKLKVNEINSDSPRQNIEKKLFTITAKVHKLSKHRDGDWKVKLTDGNDKYVNCESPNPGCKFISSSEFIHEYIQVREWIENNKDNLEGKTVTVTGVGFIDIDHKYPRNAADNDMEIHPILDIHY